MCRKITSNWQPLFSKKIAAAASFSYKIGGGGLIFLQNWRWRPHFPTKLAAAASFSYKIGGGGKDFATLLAAVLTWFGYWIFIYISFLFIYISFLFIYISFLFIYISLIVIYVYIFVLLQVTSVKIYFMHIFQNKLIFLLIYAFFNADSKSEIRIFRTALVFEL